ncbi:hypothetical protein CMT56_09290 [Elizabethkingia anophelis]|uniref:hypothetical protein n=1 Tax=Elizabethkingia anophelis TaxID=1117645 RepID=UPI000995B9B0|nr:hypothetical protein [Elizabethkingia anophelis]AQW93175.1 hypothetical protein BBD30_02700 [Elizabethkingia anophelis]MDV3854253.1 hypothetical protein [Elizabethkingia anophelis]MDV3861841.1 hypothetical protein [Elizabethkingia anophelis]MDV3909072.1 hypothetical protein [Elizabethkingia anophelis]MDV3924925.1 hypothetical protein [Elizabethkingia anophelis]
MKLKSIFFIFIILLLQSCKKEESPKSGEGNTSQIENLNISFLLDLSDRIDPVKYPNSSMPYYQRDILYIRSVEQAFVNSVKKKRLLLLNEQMQVFFDPEPQNPQMNKLSQQLKVKFSKSSPKVYIENVDKNYAGILPQIYQSAIHGKQYAGADIWRFFKNRVKDYCIENKHRNILVILTDGYMYHKDSKLTVGNKSSFITPEFIRSKKLTTSNYKELIAKNKLGFIPATEGLQNLEVLVLGINPSKNNPYEEDVIREYWTDWLTAMGVKKFYIKNADLPSNLDPVIRKIIQK